MSRRHQGSKHAEAICRGRDGRVHAMQAREEGVIARLPMYCHPPKLICTRVNWESPMRVELSSDAAPSPAHGGSVSFPLCAA